MMQIAGIDDSVALIASHHGLKLASQERLSGAGFNVVPR